MIAPQKNPSVQRQCELLGLHRSFYYYEPRSESAENLRLMRVMDRQYMECPHYGVRMMCGWLRLQGWRVNVKRVRRLYKLMGLESLTPKPLLSRTNPQHRTYPYLLRDKTVDRPDHVWSTDITYIPMAKGFMYLTAVIDWYSRYILSWGLSNTLDVDFCIRALESAFHFGKPVIFNTDQGSQYTSLKHIGVLKGNGIQISMDGKGRATDNAFIERVWRSVKYEYLYLNAPSDGHELHRGIERYFTYYNFERPHSALDYQTPGSVYLAKEKK